jgi:hypothetical protein
MACVDEAYTVTKTHVLTAAHVLPSRSAVAHELSHHILDTFNRHTGGRASTWADYQNLTVNLRRRWQDESQHTLETLSRTAERKIASLQPMQLAVLGIPNLGTASQSSSSANATRLIKWLKLLALDKVPAGAGLDPNRTTTMHDLACSGGFADLETAGAAKAWTEPALTLATSLWVVLMLLPNLVGACLRIFRDGFIQKATAPGRLIRNSARNLRGPDIASWTLYPLACGTVIV